MLRAQGSLEYMVIIAVVLAIAGITTLYMSGVLKGQSSQVSAAACKQASQTCKLSQMSSPNDPCLSCNAACVSQTTGKEVFNGATYCCNHTQEDLIYTGSSGCGGGYSYGSRADVYFDSFNNFNGWTGQLSSSCTNTGGWCINSGYTGTGAYMDSHSAYAITRAQPTMGYKDIQLSFYALTCGDAGGGFISREYLKVEWFDGSTWTTLLDINSITSWTLESYTLPASAGENPNLAVRITAYDSHDAGSYCQVAPYGRRDRSQIDDFRITGIPKL